MFSNPDRIIRHLTRHRLLVTTHGGATWEGVVLDADENTLALHQAVAVAADGARTKADGFLYLPRLDVAYMQRVP